MYTEASFSNLAIKGTWRKALAEVANFGLAQKTWSAYSTAGKMLEKCSNETGISMAFPLSESDILTFVAWLLDRNLAASTIETYLSGLRQVHLVNNVSLPILRTPLVSQILEGKKHIDTQEKRSGSRPVRLPVTPSILKLLKEELRLSDLEANLKLLLWATATICFFGALRIHELLSRRERSYDPHCTLLASDIKLKAININGKKTQILQLRLKSEKTDRIGADTILDIYESGGPLCPLKAFSKWAKSRPCSRMDGPAFVQPDGTPLTGEKFNAHLKSFLSKHLDYGKGKVTSHSFRSGMASLVAKLGYTDDELKAVGRWSSDAFNAYVKLPRTRRLQMAREIGKFGL